MRSGVVVACGNMVAARLSMAICGLGLLMCGACTKAPPKSVAPSVPAPAVETDCTLQTPLVPGVPGSPGHRIVSSRNPNGDSELSALMRTMQDALKQSRDSVARGQKVGPFAARFRKIRCAWPTDPSDRNAQFDGLAQAYLTAVRELDAADGAHVGPAYDRVLSACRACHESSCSGAIVAIEALRLGGSSPPSGP
jgi:hypothetical protein